ncbi:MAG TPA: hypothetical protein VJI46_07345 [Candidatus Nanoarchaeia archaeon]|nr:hypothetical protein [Candidatus Nanoarchaeia archaeon]
MKVDIITKKENPLLKRAEINAVVTFQGATPPAAELKKAVAMTAKGPEELIVIRKVENAFGVSKAKVNAVLYEDAASMKNYEAPEKKKAAKPKEEEKKE